MNNIVEVVDRTGRGWIRSSVVDLIEAVLKAENVEGALTVVFVGGQEMTGLNRRFRSLAEPTDVLSFRYADSDEEWPADGGVTLDTDGTDGRGQPTLDVGEVVDLGEVVVCPAVVGSYANDEGADLGERLAWTVVHGVLHLVGYDHEKDEGEMRRREQELLKELDPLVRTFAAEARRQWDEMSGSREDRHGS